MHPEAQTAAGQLLERHGIVKIPRRLSIDRDRQPLTQVLSPGELFCGDGFVNVVRLGECGFRKDVWNVMLSDDDFNIDAGLFRPAENFDHPSPRRPSGNGRPCDLDVDDVAVTRVERVRTRDADLV